MAQEQERRSIRVRGIVQGVGFRPHVYGLAARYGLGGYVRNDLEGVVIEVEGPRGPLDSFEEALLREPPPLARITSVRHETLAPVGERLFRIEASLPGNRGAVRVSPDAATCADCLRELFDPADRRFGYAFINCTNCGPRLTIVQGAPYDRDRTTMAAFPMCASCRAEFEDPLDRRFHAQPIACGACGPRLSRHPSTHSRGDPLEAAASVLRDGGIVAIKGLGGFHLACDATSERAVARLRERKQRDAKPFAILVADLEAAAAVVETHAGSRNLLASPARPIVLLRRAAGANVAASVAPASPLLGVLLPYTPLHHLLARAVRRPLVMTSGNRAGEPIARADADAFESLGAVADLFLTHDRPIAVRCDDSVHRFDAAEPIPFRRSRGFAPAPTALPLPLARPTLAAGGHLKATFALGASDEALVSHHLGDLDGYDAQRAYKETIAHYAELFHVHPERIVHDRHPDYASTRLARDEGVELVAVQHHHAHMASCLAENAFLGKAIGVVWDGAGLGTDGAIWGGELLLGDYAAVRRVAHWAYVPMPGGEQATREPWRMALAHLLAAGLDGSSLAGRASERAIQVVAAMAARGINSPLTSSVGRLFDAVAALVGTHDRVSFEGQAAIRLEALAATEPRDGAYPFDLGAEEPIVVGPGPLVRAVCEDVRRRVPAARIARRFHTTLVEVVLALCERLRSRHAANVVALSGGVFMNAILSEEATRALERHGFRVLRHRRFPPNDGGLSLGQLAVAAGLDAAAGRS